MLHEVIEIFKSVHHLFSHYLRVLKLFKGFNSVTYCEDKSQLKSKLSVFVDFLYLFFVLRVFPANYFLFQFDCKKRKQFRVYMDESSSPILKRKLYECLWDEHYDYLVHDKYLFQCFCGYHNLAVPQIYGMYRNGEFYGDGFDLKDVMSKNSLERVVLKPARGALGEGIHFILRKQLDSLPDNGKFEDYFKELLKKGDFIVQEVLSQHPELSRINPSSVNTVRIITFLSSGGQVNFLAAILRTSSGVSALDNFSLGGIVIGIDLKSGKLLDRGFMRPEFGTTVRKHPITNFEFKNFEVPLWKEVKEVAENAQKAFHYLKSIGWDIAVTPERPVLIEGNVEWGNAGIQAANGGLLTEKNKELFSQYGLHI